MAFEWNRIHKWEENIESQVTDSVFEYVCEHFGVDDVTELSEAQIQELETFRDEQLNEFSVMQWGFSNLLSQWENENVNLD